MWAFLAGLLPLIQGVINWWQGVEAEQTAANTAEAQAEVNHENDGAQSVADRTSDAAQNAALDNLASQIDAPPVVVTTTKGS